MGAWIEINNSILCTSFLLVAPLVGAWIEILAILSLDNGSQVAPLVGAWIEILLRLGRFLHSSGRSPRGSVD